MAIIECLTDNPNRTFGDVRLAFTKTDCKIGTQGSVAHQFDHVAIFVFDFDNEEAAMACVQKIQLFRTLIKYLFLFHTQITLKQNSRC